MSTCAMRLVGHRPAAFAPASPSSSRPATKQRPSTFATATVTARVVGGGKAVRPRSSCERRARVGAVVVVERVTSSTIREAPRGAAVVCGATAAGAGGYNSGGSVGGSSGGEPSFDMNEWWKTFTKAKWDESPKPWKEFWAVKVRACVRACVCACCGGGGCAARAFVNHHAKPTSVPLASRKKTMAHFFFLPPTKRHA